MSLFKKEIVQIFVGSQIFTNMLQILALNFDGLNNLCSITSRINNIKDHGRPLAIYKITSII